MFIKMAITLPTVPPYYTNPLLDYNVAQKLQIALDTKLGWLDRAYHIARRGIDSSQKTTYPQIYKNNGTDEHADIRPDNKIGSYCFFEVERPFDANTYEDTLKCYFNLIFWNNLKIVDPNKGYDFTSELIKEVLDVLDIYGCSVTTAETRPERIFENYNGLTQELKQHLMRRYSGFKISFDITTSYSISCSPVIIDSCAQNIERINNLPQEIKDCVLAYFNFNS